MSQLRKFIARVDQSRNRIKPGTKTIAVPKELLIVARDYIAAAVDRSAEGGKRSRGHRYQNVPEHQLSQTPKAKRERERRRKLREG